MGCRQQSGGIRKIYRSMEEVNKNNTIIIMATTSGFSYEGFVSEGYQVLPAYKKICTALRILREFCFRLPFLPKEIWYDRKVLTINPKYIIVRDAIITKDYLEWLQEHFHTAQINFWYENMVGRARHLYPHEIPNGIRVWTYEPYDSEKYHIRLKKTFSYPSCFVKEKKVAVYDVLFVGRDKGRGDMLMKLEAYLKEYGLRTKFVITSNGRFSPKKKYYQSEVSYRQITDWISESRSILNVALENQRGVTVRDMESLFHKVKLITTNKNISKVEFYKEKNVYILNDNNWNGLLEFLQYEYDDSQNIELKKYTLEEMIKETTDYINGDGT